MNITTYRTSSLIRRLSLAPFSTSANPVSLAEGLAPKLVDHLHHGHQKPVVNFKNPTELYEHFRSIGVPLEIGKTNQSFNNDDLLRACDAVLQYSVNTTSPMFNNQLYGTADPVGVAGKIIDKNHGFQSPSSPYCLSS
jgi:hypothetical protein